MIIPKECLKDVLVPSSMILREMLRSDIDHDLAEKNLKSASARLLQLTRARNDAIREIVRGAK